MSPQQTKLNREYWPRGLGFDFTHVGWVSGERMATIRVYELARDLNLTNKILLERLSKMEIAVKKKKKPLRKPV
jgi:hypothetical protein